MTDRLPEPADAAPDPGADAPAAPAPAGQADGRRPGLPHREPGKARPRKRVPAAPDGTIDPGEPDPRALAMARRIVELAEDKKAIDIVLLDVRALTTVTDYIVLCCGGSERQLGAIADGVAEGLKADGTLPIGREGTPASHWVLLDFGAAILHVMAAPEREYYALDALWADATLLVKVL